MTAARAPATRSDDTGYAYSSSDISQLGVLPEEKITSSRPAVTSAIDAGRRVRRGTNSTRPAAIRRKQMLEGRMKDLRMSIIGDGPRITAR